MQWILDHNVAFIACLVLMASTAMGDGGCTTPPQTWEVSGTVRNAATVAALAGVAVTLGGRGGTSTTSSGLYRLMIGGSHTLVVSKPCFAKIEQKVNIRGAARFDFSMQPVC